MFWDAIASLIIVKPLFVNVSGAFIYGDDENGFLGRKPEKLDYRSNVTPLHSFPSFIPFFHSFPKIKILI